MDARVGQLPSATLPVREDTVGSDSSFEPRARAVFGPFTPRDVTVMVSSLLILMGSLIPFLHMTVLTNAWLHAAWQFNQVLYLVLPVIVGVGFAWRRLARRALVRVGSLTLDQAGSVLAILAVAYFFFAGANTLSPAYLLCLLGALGLAAGTTASRYIQAFASDFAPGSGPLLTRPVLVSTPRPLAPSSGPGVSPVAEAVPERAAAATASPAPKDQDAVSPAAAVVHTHSHHVVPEPSEAFWFAVPEARPAYDVDTGQVIFTLEPGEWNLALADRGDHFLVQDVEGRLGLLRQLDAVQRA